MAWLEEIGYRDVRSELATPLATLAGDADGAPILPRTGLFERARPLEERLRDMLHHHVSSGVPKGWVPPLRSEVEQVLREHAARDDAPRTSAAERAILAHVDALTSPPPAGDAS